MLDYNLNHNFNNEFLQNFLRYYTHFALCQLSQPEVRDLDFTKEADLQ